MVFIMCRKFAKCRSGDPSKKILESSKNTECESAFCIAYSVFPCKPVTCQIKQDRGIKQSKASDVK